MSLTPIDNGVISFASDTQSCKNNDTQAYARLLQSGDRICFQMQNAPCGNSLFNCVDTNVVPNPDFADDSDWTLDPEWSIALGYLSHVAGDTGTAITSPILTTGTWYAVTYTIKNYVSGDVNISLAGSPGTSVGATRSANGTYTENIYYDGIGTGSVSFEPSIDFVGSIDEVYVAKASDVTCLTCVPTNNNLLLDGDFSSSGSWNVTAGWTIIGGVASHTGTSTGTLSQIVAALVPTANYIVTFTIKNYVSGVTRVQLGNGTGVNQGTARSANGTYTETLTLNSADNTLYFTLQSGTNVFDIDDVIILDLASGCVAAGIWQLTPDGYQYNPASEIISLQTNVGTLGVATIGYQVQFRIKGMTTGSITPGWLWDSDFSIHSFGSAINGNGLFTFYTTPEEDAALVFVPSIDFDGEIITADISVKVMNYSHEIRIIDLQGNNISEPMNDEDSGVFYHEDVMTWCREFNETEVFDAPGTFIPTGCYKMRVIDDCAEEIIDSTTVINYKSTDTWPCTVFMEATCEGNGLGYDFTHFSYYLRVKMLRITPKYPSETEQYVYSNGRKSRTFVQNEKHYIAWFSKTDEDTHDAIDKISLCDKWLVDDKEWFREQEGYEPEWAENNKRNLCQSRIQISAQGKVLFNRNI